MVSVYYFSGTVPPRPPRPAWLTTPGKQGPGMAQKIQTTLRPLQDRVLIKPLAEGDEKHGSIIIPDTAKEKPQEGKVVAVGTGRVTEEGKNQPLAVKQGDRILFGKYSGSEIKLDGEEFLIMKEEDILGVRSEEHTSELQSQSNLVCRL